MKTIAFIKRHIKHSSNSRINQSTDLPDQSTDRSRDEPINRQTVQRISRSPRLMDEARNKPQANSIKPMPIIEGARARAPSMCMANTTGLGGEGRHGFTSPRDRNGPSREIATAWFSHQGRPENQLRETATHNVITPWHLTSSSSSSSSYSFDANEQKGLLVFGSSSSSSRSISHDRITDEWASLTSNKTKPTEGLQRPSAVHQRGTAKRCRFSAR